jgi:hypothetical protein
VERLGCPEHAASSWITRRTRGSRTVPSPGSSVGSLTGPLVLWDSPLLEIGRGPSFAVPNRALRRRVATGSRWIPRQSNAVGRAEQRKDPHRRLQGRGADVDSWRLGERELSRAWSV